MEGRQYKLIHGDCLEVMKTLADNSIDLCLTDPPYGTTACKWDSVIPFEPMWKELKRICKPKGAICLFGSQPFTSALIMSNPKDFKYEWIWEKSNGSNFALANKMPLKVHENILVFYSELPIYNPQKTFSENNRARLLNRENNTKETVYGVIGRKSGGIDKTRMPRSVQRFKIPPRSNQFYKQPFPHPTQKPVELLRYLIRTYTKEDETVLDFTMGSGSTGVACQLENRRFIGIEKELNYFEIAQQRIEQAQQAQPLFANAA